MAQTDRIQADWLNAPGTRAVMAALEAARPGGSRFVGGCVRNTLRGIPADDIDIATQILPDDVIAADTPCLQQMTEAYQETGGNMVAAMEVPADKASAYGILDVQEDMGSMVSVKGMVEKPKAGEAPSNLAVIGRYILSPKILENLDAKTTGAGGEIQLTDAIAKEINGDEGVYGYRFNGQRYDCGSKAGFLQATVAFGLSRDDLRDDLEAYLHEVVSARKAAQ